MNRFRIRALLISLSYAWACSVALALTVPTTTGTRTGASTAKMRRARHAPLAAAHPALAQVSHRVTPVSEVAAPVIRGGPWISPTFADSTMATTWMVKIWTVRRSAVDALGAYNGSVVVVDPSTGRILTIVNQQGGA